MKRRSKIAFTERRIWFHTGLCVGCCIFFLWIAQIATVSFFWGNQRNGKAESFSQSEPWRKLRTQELTHPTFQDSQLLSLCETSSGHSEKRVLVTGSVGFIGFHAAIALSQRGDFVIGFDNFNDYYPVVLKFERDRALQALGIYTIQGNLTDGTLLEVVLNTCRITHVVHLAAQAGVRYAKDHPIQYIKSNVQGSVTLFEAARHSNPSPVIVYASSSSVYGSNTESPFSEEHSVDHPTSLYGVTKRSVELTAGVYTRLFDLSMTGLRLFTVYGPYGRPDMACFQFAKSILMNQTIQIFTTSDGKELARDFTYVDDIVRGIMGALDTAPPSVKPLAMHRIFNLGNTHPYTVTEFVDSLERALQRTAIKDYVSVENNGDVFFTHANVSKATFAFNFTPIVSLDEGLDRFASWFKDYAKEMSPELWFYPNS